MSSEVEFKDGYRSVFRFNLDRGETVASVAEHYVRDWLATRKGGVARNALDQWDGVGPTTLPGGTSISVASYEDQRSGANAVRYRITDPADTGEYQVTISALAEESQKQPGALFVVEVGRSAGDSHDAARRTQPPRIVGQVLDERRVFDGRTRLQGRPRTIHTFDIDELVEAIADPDRQVSVVLASSPAPHLDEKWRAIVEGLTRGTVGTAAVYAVAGSAVDALNEALPRGLETTAGQIRTIAPRVDIENPDVRRHPVLEPEDIGREIDESGRWNPSATVEFALRLRKLLLDAPMPTPARRGMALLSKEERRTLVSSQVEEQVEETATTKPSPRRVFPRRTDHHARDRQTTRYWADFYALLAKWLGKEPTEITEHSVEDDLRSLDLQITRDREQIAVQEKFLSRAEADRESLNVQLAEVREEAVSLKARLEEALAQVESAQSRVVEESMVRDGDKGLSSLEAKVSQVEPGPADSGNDSNGLRESLPVRIDPRFEVQRALDFMVTRLDPIIESVMAPRVGGHEWTSVLSELDRSRGRNPGMYHRLDPAAQLRMLTERLGPLGFPFESDLNRTVSTTAQVLRTLRNYMAHNYELEDLDGFRVHDNLATLLYALDDNEGGDVAAAMREEAQRAIWSGPLADAEPAASSDESESGSDDHEDEVADVDDVDDTDNAAPTGQSMGSMLVDPLFGDAAPRSLFDAADDEAPILGQAHQTYEPWETVGEEDPEHLEFPRTKAARQRIQGVVAQIVEAEGPIAMNRLLRLTGREFGFRRLHSERAHEISRHVKATGLLVDEDGFVWPEGVDPETWTQFRPNDYTTERDFTDISPVEIRNAARSVREKNPDLEGDAFEVAVLEVFGRKRRTESVRAHLQKSLG